jgi:hypothetical protein
VQALDAVLAIALFALLHCASSLASRTDRPIAQALARIATLLPAYLHELAHAAVSIALTGRGRVRLHSVSHRGDGAARADGQVAIGSSDVFYFGPRSNALVSAAPALLLWPAAAWLAWLAWHGGGAAAAGAVSVLVCAGRLSDSDLEHLHAAFARRQA